MKTFYILLIASISLLFGCAQQNEIFYWGDYSSTLYDLTKDPNEKTLEAHKKELLSIFEYCDKQDKKVPPGVSCEYAYILLKEGKDEEGLSYLEKEITLYPESAIFVNRIKAEYERGKK